MMKIKSSLDQWPVNGIISLHINQHKDIFNYPMSEMKQALRQWLIDPEFCREYILSMGVLYRGAPKPLAALYVLFNNIEVTYGINALNTYAIEYWNVNTTRKAA